MKAQITKVQPKFTPIELKITIESEQELDFLLNLFGTNESIPDLLIQKKLINKYQRAELGQLMGDIANTISGL